MVVDLTSFTIVFSLLLSFCISENPCRFESNDDIIDLISVGLSNGTAKYNDRKTPLHPDYSLFNIKFISILIKKKYFINCRF